MPSRNTISDNNAQLALPLTALRNKNFLSSHWLEHRFPLEPEWNEDIEATEQKLNSLLRLWQVEKERVELYGDEAGLEEKFIQPVFEILGWKLKYQAFLDRREADYALFTSDDSLDAAIRAGRKNPDFWSHVSVVADAKAWHVSLDRPTRVGSRREYPPEQIEWYLNHSLCDYGILTNGRLWRLSPRVLGPSKPRFQTFLEFDLPFFLNSFSPEDGQLDLGPSQEQFELFQRFVLLFSPTSFITTDDRSRLVDRAVSGSSEYSLGVGEELRDRVFEALRLSIEGFVSFTDNGLDPDNDLNSCQEHSLIFLYRLLFIMYAEDRGLLPYRLNQTYTNNRSLSRHRDDVAARLDQVHKGHGNDYRHDSHALWDDLFDLFDLIDRGHKRYGVQAYNGGLFDIEGNDFLAKVVLPDYYLARVLDYLGRTFQPNRRELGLFKVDYRDLAIQQLGRVYEGLLEMHPRYATVDTAVIRKTGGGSKTELLVAATDPTPKGFERTDILYPAGSVYLSTDKGERRRSGSYYTPDHIVDHIVLKAIGQKCSEISSDLDDQVAALKRDIGVAQEDEKPSLERQLNALEGSFDDRVLELSVLDPAMGSGHFLIRACQYLAEEIATHPYTSDPTGDELTGEEPTVTFWKRRVAENCLYGVDINPLAVELAKLAIWLETVSSDAPLTFLDHHFRCGDSIVGAHIDELDSLPGDRGLFKGQFQQEIADALPKLLAPLEEIDELDSDTAEHVKEKEKIFNRRFLPILERFTTVANIWTLEAMEQGSIEADQYTDSLALLSRQRKFLALMRRAWAQGALDRIRSLGVTPFHWELAFAELFLGANPGQGRGVDIIIGNPPYDVLSEKEIGQNIKHFKSYISSDKTLTPSLGGKNNLYKLFICRSISLLKPGGTLGFIVPMALLGDEQSRGIRELMLSTGHFDEIHAFPQKDDTSKRVFPEAKLSTAVFLFRKYDKLDNDSIKTFVSSTHNAQYIEESSSSLTLDAKSILIYDPKNVTIVSCDQKDWDLVASLDDHLITRLGEYAKFFQGEVNQTIAAKKGFLTDNDGGPLVTRGANLCLYQSRTASQGEDIFLDVDKFLAGKGPGTKAFHSRLNRVGLQESSPQNNFRRIIACRIPAGAYCNHTINYTTDKHSSIPLELVLFVLNSLFAEWYFRLGSTNAHVSHYQLINIPCPKFENDSAKIDTRELDNAASLLGRGKWSKLRRLCVARCEAAACDSTTRQLIVSLVRYAEDAEKRRGGIGRSERSQLSDDAQKVQDILDEMYLLLIGQPGTTLTYIRERLQSML